MIDPLCPICDDYADGYVICEARCGFYMVACLDCADRLCLDLWKFCPYCGKPLDDGPEEDE